MLNNSGLRKDTMGTSKVISFHELLSINMLINYILSEKYQWTLTGKTHSQTKLKHLQYGDLGNWYVKLTLYKRLLYGN